MISGGDIAMMSPVVRIMLSRVSNHVSTSLQNRISNHLLGLDLAFFQKNSVGQIIARATDDVNVLNNTSTNIVVTLGRDLVTFLGLVIYVLWASPQWFLLALAGGPLIAIPAVIANRKLRALMRHGSRLRVFRERRSPAVRSNSLQFRRIRLYEDLTLAPLVWRRRVPGARSRERALCAEPRRLYQERPNARRVPPPARLTRAFRLEP